ncbi:hypothetical protein [Paenibacillus cymbidii]|uniref:hypothetical protein n=1 Tax=Paenibacillus cymbidii TaxID=1639034 RepID=UPI0010811091|nr:hypothetical protein [Paenibacillus cymbidii]
MIKRMGRKGLLLALALATLIGVLWTGGAGNTALAGKPGVFLNGSTYFLLDKAVYYAGSDTGSLHFSIQLVNGSSSAVDFNNYGVRVTNAAGSSYSATLTEQTSARVQPGATQTYSYTADIPSSETIDKMSITFFAWNMNAASYMDDLGSLALSEVLQPVSAGGKAARLNLKDFDSTLSDDTYVSIQLSRSYKALANGTWSLYTDVLLKNEGSASIKVPASLLFRYKDENDVSYMASAAYTSDQTILPGRQALIVVQASVGGSGDTDRYKLDFVKTATAAAASPSPSGAAGATGQTSAGSGSSNTDYILLGSIDLQGSMIRANVGDPVLYSSKDADALTMETDSVTYQTKSDGVHIDAAFVFTNNSKSVLPVPGIAGSFQLGQSTYLLPAAESATHPAFLSPGESTTYHFTATYPQGIDPGSVQLVVMEKRATTPVVNTPIQITKLPAGNAGGTVVDPASGIATSVGKLGLAARNSYRLSTDGTDDVIMTEIQVTNLESHLVALPAAASLYGGHSIGDFDAGGKAIRLQTSPYLNPGQSTILYVYTNVPFNTTVDQAIVYLGDGTYNSASSSWSAKTEWAELPVTLGTTAFGQANGNEWFIADAGRQSTGKVVDSQVYDTGTQKLVAVRVLQTNKEVRSASIIPYTGYAATADGSVFALSATDDSTVKSCRDCGALTTLWTKLPSGMTPDQMQFMFGQKIDGQAFASPQQYLYLPAAAPTYSVSNVQLYPYTISVNNAKIASTVANNKQAFTITFDYNQSKSADIAGAAKNRGLQFELVDVTGKSINKWDTVYPLEKTGSVNPLTIGSNTLTTMQTIEISDLNNLLQYSRYLKVYESFEGATRLIGTLDLSFN